MGTGQMLITIGAIMLLGTVILGVNRTMMDSGQVMNTSNYGLEQVALAIRVIQEAESKSYDQSTADGLLITSPNNFSPVLGQESGANDFDDFDDYNNYQRTFANLATGDYRVTARVRYVRYNSATGKLDTTSVRQWSKRIDVAVWNTVDTAHVIRMHAIMSYWN